MMGARPGEESGNGAQTRQEQGQGAWEIFALKKKKKLFSEIPGNIQKILSDSLGRTRKSVNSRKLVKRSLFSLERK